ncbi:MAG TPA: chemotaxis protein CheB [Polyangia bacterium]|nr:chemotaxis protein CheB [Polyangia bacterium]
MDAHDTAAIVIGGSAGALEALGVILPALPSSCDVPIVVVVHLPPAAPSLLPAVLQPWTALLVKEVDDKEPVVGRTIYVAPPNYHLLVERDRTFALSVDDLVHHSRPAIDVLFESASEVYGPRLAGVVLTGANADGAAGLAAIKKRGGLTIAQSPGSAAVPTMPRAAIDTGAVDHVLPPAEIAALLLALTRSGRVDGREPR